MKCEVGVSHRQLEDAFQVFNQTSLQLVTSYRDLETQVAHLSTELSSAHDDRLKQLAEKELLANRLERLLDALPAGVMVLNNDGRIQEANRSAHELLGDTLIDQLWDDVAQREFVAGEDELRLHDGRWVSVSTRSLGSEPGKIILVTDVTETHNLQDTVNRQQRLTSLGEMAASLAHQIRTPLASVLLYLSHLHRPLVPDSKRLHFVDKVSERLRHVERMINDMLVFARGGTMEMDYFPVRQLVDDLVQTIEPLLKKCRGTMIVDYQMSAAILYGNHAALLGVFHNLVTNAIQACGDAPPRLKLVVSLGSDGVMEFSLSDNGLGIANEIKDRIFEPFFTTRMDGTGLGLAVVDAVVRSHNGELRVLSEPDVGSTFSMRFLLPEQLRILANSLMTDDSRNLPHDLAGYEISSYTVSDSNQLISKREMQA